MHAERLASRFLPCLRWKVFLWWLLLVFAEPTANEQFFPTQLIITQTAFQNSQVLGGIPFGPTVVELKDAAYKTVTVNDGRFITATLLSEGQSSLTGDVVLRFGDTASDGVATFSSLEIRRICVQCRLHFECQGLQVDSEPFDVIESPPAAIRVVSIPPDGVVNVDLDPTPAIQLVDSGGNLITTQFSANISKAAGFGQLRNRRNILTNTSRPDLENTVFFTEIFFDAASEGSAYAVRFDARIPGGNVVSLVVPSLRVTTPVRTAAIQSNFAVENQTAMVPFAIQPVITVRDQFGYVVTADSGSIVIAATIVGGDPGATLQGSTAVRTDQGVATFTDLAIDKVGRRFSIVFSHPQFTTFGTDIFDVFTGPIANFEVTVQPATIVAGQVFASAPTVNVLDAGRNLFPGAAAVSLSLAENSEGAQLLGDPSLLLVNAVNGVASFPGLSVDKIGSNFRLLFQSGQEFSVLSESFEVLAASPSSIVMTTQPGSALRGILLSVAPAVSLLDIFGNIVAENSNALQVGVELIGQLEQATLAGTTSLVFQNGTAVFSDLSVNNPGLDYILRFTANQTFITQSQPFTITGLETDLDFLTQPGGATGGTAFLNQPVVALIDINRQIVATASNVIEVTLIPGSDSNVGILSPIQARAESRFGVVTFTNLAVDVAGSEYRLSFRTLLGSSISAESAPFDVLVGPPSRLLMVVQPTDYIAATQLDPLPSMKAVDAGGNTVRLSSTVDVAVVWLGDALQSFTVALTDGEASINQTIPLARQSYRLVLTLVVGGLELSVTSRPFAVAPGVPASLTVDVEPMDAIVGVNFFRNPVIGVRDAGNNLVPTYSSPVVVSRGAGPSGSYPIGNLSVTPENGVATFANVQISDTAKIYQLDFRTERLGVVLSALSAVFAITLEPRRLRLIQFPERAIGGERFTINTIAEVLDSEGTPVTALALPFNASVAPPARLLGTQVKEATNGVVEFTDLAIDLVGFHDVVISYAGFSASFPVEVQVGEPNDLTIFTQPVNCMSNTRFFVSPSVRFLDRGGNVVPGVSDTVAVRVLQNAGASSLEGTTSLAATNGIATFTNLRMVGLGNGFTLLFSSGSFEVESGRFSVQGEVTSLALVHFPAGVILDQNIDPFIKVAVLDDALNVIDGGNWRPPFVRVHVSLPTLSYPGISTPNIAITGTTTAVAHRGVAVFTDLRVTADTSSYQGVMLQFTTNISTPSIRSPFFSPSFAEDELIKIQEPSSLQTTGLTLQPFPTLQVIDGLSAVVRGSAAYCLVELTGSSVPATLAGTTRIFAAAGVFTFTDLSIKKASEPTERYTLVFTVEGRADIPALSSVEFNVIIGPAAIIEFQSGLLFESSGLPFAQQPCIALQDAGTNLIQTQASVSATLLGPSESTLAGTTAASSGGLAAFTNMAISQVVPGATYRIAFTSAGLELVSPPFEGVSGHPAGLDVVVQPSDATSSIIFSHPPVVRVTDAGGTLVRDFVSVTVSLVDRGGVVHPEPLIGGEAMTINGTATFDQLSVGPAGEGFSLHFVSGIANVRSTPFSVSVGAGVRLALASTPSPSVFGVSLYPVPSALVLDAGGNWVSTAAVSVTIVLIIPEGHPEEPPSVLSGETHRVMKLGVANFVAITINNAGEGYRLEVQSPGLESDMTEPFDVSGPPAKLVVSRQPSGRGASREASADRPLAVQPVVTVVDFGGRAVRYDQLPATITASLNGPGTLSGALEADVIRGEATFKDLQILQKIDAAVISFHYRGPLLEASISASPFQVLSGRPNHLQITRQPGSSTRGLPLGLQPTLRILDEWGNDASWFAGSVRVQLFQGIDDTTAYLEGTLSAEFDPDSAGVAEFLDLQINLEGDGFTMHFQSGGFRAQSQTFNIKQGPPFALVSRSARVPAGVLNINQGVLEPQPLIHVVDRGYFKVDSMDGSNCAGSDCVVSIQLICCPQNFLGDYVGAGTLRGTTSVITQQGVATFTNVQIDAAGDYTLTFTVESIEGISPRITVNLANIYVQQITSLGITTQPSHAILGLPLRYQPIIQILDSSSQGVRGAILNVSVAITAGVGCSGLSGTTLVAVNTGIASFSDLTISSFAGGSNCQLTFTTDDPSLTAVSDSFTISFGPCSLSVSTQPGGVNAGAPFQVQPVVQFRELGGALLASESGQSVSVEVFRDGQGTSCGVQSCSQELRGNTMAFNFEGEARFTDLRLDTPNTGGYVLMFTMGRFAAFSILFNVSIGPAARLVILRQPSDARIGMNMEPFMQVAIQDEGGNVVTTATDTVTASVLPTASFGISIVGGAIAAQNGIAEFSGFQLSHPALMLSLRFSSGQMSVSSTSFSVHDAPAQLVLREFNTDEIVAGARMVPEPQLAVVDRLGFITSSDSTSEVSALLAMSGANYQTSDFTNFTNATLFRGIAQFDNIRVFLTGQASIRFFFASHPSIFVDSPFFSVRAGAASSLQIVQQPQSTGAGLLMFPFPEVRILDDWSNTIQSSDDIVEVCVSNNLECIPSVRVKGTLRAVPVAGRVVFSNLVLDGAPGLQNYLMFKIGNVGITVLPVHSDAFELRFGLPQLSITQQPKSAALGSPLQQQPVLAVTDASLTVLSYGMDYLTVTATLESFSISGATLTDSSGPCPCIARFRGGVAEFDGLEISDAGQAFAIRFSSPDLKLNDVVSEPFIVTAAAVYVQVVGTPTRISYRENFDVEVSVLDPNGNLVGVPSISVQLRKTSGILSGSLRGDHTLEALTGSATFRNLSVSTVGEGYFLQFAALELVGKSNIFTVTQREATAVMLGTFPEYVLAGQTLPMPPLILIVDEFGSPSAFNDTVTVRVEDENHAVIQTINDVEVTSGEGTFQDLIFQNAGTGFVVTVTASVVDLGIQISGSSNLFNVVPGPLAQLAVTTHPSNGIVGRLLRRQPVVAAQDAVGNVLAGFDRTITASLHTNFSSVDEVMTGGRVLLASEGVVSFTDLIIGSEGTYSLVISTKESCGIQTETNAFTITGDVATISVTQAPSGAEGGSVFLTQPELVLLDQSGDVVVAADQAVSVQTCDQSAEVLGTATMRTDTGVVSYTDLRVNPDGAYTLCFGYELLSATSPLTVTIGDARFISFLVQPVILLAETEWSLGTPSPQVQLTDAGGNVVTAVTFLYVQILDDRTRIDSVKVKGVLDVSYSSGQIQVRSNAITALTINRPARQIRVRMSIVGTSGFVESQPFDVVGGSCFRLVVVVQPGDAILGEVFKRPPSVQVEDNAGNVAPWVDDTLQLQIGSAHTSDAILSGCETSQSPIDGVISFIGCSITCTVAAGTTGCLGNDYTLVFRMPNLDTCIGTTTSSVTSAIFHLSQAANAITVSALSADSIAATLFDPQPFVTFFNIPCGPEDFCAVRMSDSTRVVTARLEKPSNNANLTGTTSVPILDGVARFTNLAISEALTGYNISFSTTGMAALYVQMDVVVGSVASLRVTSQPTLSQPAAAFGCSVSLYDAGGNLVDAGGEQLAITVSLLDDLSKFYGAVLDTSQASLTQVSELGVATWSGLTVYLAPVVYTFVFSGTTVDGVSVSTMSEKIALAAGTLFELRLHTQPQSRESGVTLNEITVELVDEGGNRIVDTDIQLTASISKGAGTLSGLTSIVSSDGFAIFPNLTIAYASGDSHHQLQFSVSSIFVRSNPFLVHLAPTQIVFRTWPSETSTVSAVLAEQPQIELRDSLNNRAFGSTDQFVRATLEGGSALTGKTILPAIDGVVAFTNLVIFQAGSYTLSFFHVNTSATIASNNITVTAGPATSLIIQSDYQPGGSTNNATKFAGVSLPVQPRVRLLDDGGGVPIPSNYFVIASLRPPGGGTPGDEILYGTSAILPDAATGIATFTNLAVNLVGTFMLTFSSGTLSVSSENFKIEVGPIAQISFSTQPGNAVFSTVLGQQPSVLLLDAGGNRVKGTPWLHIELGLGTTSGSSLQGCSEEYAALNSGEVIFIDCSVTGTTPGLHSVIVHTVLTSFDQVGGTTDTLILESDRFYVSGPPSRLEFHAPGSGGRSPDPFPDQPVINLVDIASTLVRSFEGNISVSTELGLGNLSGSTTLAVSDGTVSFTDLRLLASGRFVLLFQEASLGFVVAQNISIMPGPPDSLALINVPSQTVAGSVLLAPSSTLPPAAVLTDLFGNSVENELQVEVTMNCTRPGPCLNGTLVESTFEGRAVFRNVFPLQAGLMQLSFTLIGTNSLGATAVLEIVPGTLSRLIFAVQPPTSVLVRTAFDPNPVVELQDSYGNRLTTNEGTCTFYLATSLMPGATLLGQREVAVVNGVVTLTDASVSAAGVDFHLGCRGFGIEAQSRRFSVYEQHCCLHLVQMPQTVFGGVSFEIHPVLNLVDQADDIVAVSGQNISVALEFGAATLSGQTQVAAVEGRAVFSHLSIDKTGTFRLVFSSSGSHGVTTVVSDDVIVMAGPATSLHIYQQPGGFASGGLAFPIQPVVLVVDAGGNIANETAVVTASLPSTSNGAMLGGEIELMSGGLFGAPLETNEAGVVTFQSLSINFVGTYSLVFSSVGLEPTTSAAFYVELGPAARLYVSTQPADAISGQPFLIQPRLHVQDAGGNLVAPLSYTITASIQLHSTRYSLLSEVLLGGNAVAQSQLGSANFTDLSVDVPGEFCIIRFTSSGLLAVDSHQFAVGPAAPLSGCPPSANFLSDCGPSKDRTFFLHVQTPPSETSSNETMHPAPVVVLRDYDGMQIDKDGDVRVVLVALATGLHSSPARMSHGVAQFTELRIDAIGTGIQLRFLFEDVWADSDVFDVVAGTVARLELGALPVEWVVDWVLPSFSVSLLDAGSNVAADFGSCTSISLSKSTGPASGQLIGTTVATVTAGFASFSDITFSETGHFTISAACSDDAAAILPARSEILPVLPYGVPARFIFVADPADAIASFDSNSAFTPYYIQSNPSVAMVDAVGNLVKGFQGIFRARQNTTSTGIALGAGDSVYAFPLLGVAEFQQLFFEISTANFQRGVIAVLFQSTATSLTQTLTGEVRINANAEQVTISLPSSPVAGEGFSTTLRFSTSDGTPVSTYTGRVDVFLLNSTSNTTIPWAFPGDQATTTNGGSVTLSGLIVRSPGTYRLVLRCSRPTTFLPELAVTSESFLVIAGQIYSLAVRIQPAGCFGGVICTTQPVIQVLDRVGNVVPATGTQVTASIVGDTNSEFLSGTLIASGDSNGDVSFVDLVIAPSGYLVMNFSGPGYVLSDPVLVLVGEKAKARIFVEPMGLEAGVSFLRQPLALAADFGGNWVAGISDIMQVEFICGTGCTQFGNFTAPTVNGVAEFTDLGVNFAGQIQIRFRLSSTFVCGIESCWDRSSLLDVQPGQLAQLVVRTNISEYICSATTISPAVEIEVQDASGNLLSTGGTYIVSVSLPANPAGLSGQLSVETVDGIASFGDLSVAEACSLYSSDPISLCYHLAFASGSVSTSSNSFSILAGAPVGIQFNESPQNTAVGHRASISSLSLADAHGNPFVELPAGFVNLCGGNTALDPATITAGLATEQLLGNAMLLGQGEKEAAGASVALLGVSVNWKVASCPSSLDCRVGSEDDYKIMRIRASANYGSYVADSSTFMVDVAQPVNFQVSRTSHTSILLNWNAPFHGPIPSTYILSFRTIGVDGGTPTEIAVPATTFSLSGIWYADLYEFTLCSQSIFGDGCAVKPPAPVVAAAVEPAQAVQVVFVNEDRVIISWTEPSVGPPPESYQVTATEVPDGFESVIMSGINGSNTSITSLQQNTTYVLKLYPKSVAGDFHAPTGPSTAEFVLTAAAQDVTVRCPSGVCTGTSLQVAWTRPTGVMIQPKAYRVASSQVTLNGTAVQSQLDVTDTVTSVVLGDLEKGRPVTIRVLANNRVFPTFYALSASANVIPVSPPSSPADLKLRMVGTTLVQIDWMPPMDSGDGTTNGLTIVSYLLDYKASGAVSYEPAVEVFGQSFTVQGLQSGTNYTFRVRAQTAPVIGTICQARCAPIPPLSLVGEASERSLVFGRVPIWDELQAPPIVDPPTLYNLFVGNLFSFQVRALSLEAGQVVTISATGLSDCGAELVPNVVGNPSLSTLLFLPSVQQMDKTFWICFLATDSYGAFSDQRCIRLFVASPRPAFTRPDQALGDPDAPTLEAVAGCELSIRLEAHDLTSGKDVTAQEAASRGYLVRIQSDTSIALSQYGEAASPSLPAGAVLAESDVEFANPSSRMFHWTPARGQESFTYLVCFRLLDSLATYNSASAQSNAKFCTRVRVARCKYCMKAGDSLYSIAQDWGTEWLNLWAGNDLLTKPGQTDEKTEVRLGPLLSVSHQDSLVSLATKFSVSVQDILAWNPDLHAQVEQEIDLILFDGQEICVLPGTCIN